MKKILKVHFQRIWSLFVLCVLCVAMFLGGQMTAPVAYADTAIGDVQINAETNVFAFAEYCYSFYSNLQGNYGLYVYVHNPRGLTFNLRSLRNTIQFRAGEQEHSAKYSLLYLNQCEEQNYEGLFIKFKVIMTAEQKADIFANLNSAERVYDVTEIELVILL